MFMAPFNTHFLIAEKIWPAVRAMVTWPATCNQNHYGQVCLHCARNHLSYLAQSGQSRPREFIADLLWDNRATPQAFSNLRTALTRLQKQVDDALVVTRKSLALKPESRQQVDSALLLEALLRFGRVNSDEKACTLEKTLGAYRGDFLAHFCLPDAPQFEAWVVATREHIRQQVIHGYNKLGDIYCLRAMLNAAWL